MNSRFPLPALARAACGALLCWQLALPALAQTAPTGVGAPAPSASAARIRVERADQLPRFTYKVDAPLESIVREKVRFDAFMAPVRRDVEDTLARYDIAELRTQRSYLGLLTQLDMLSGQYQAALKRSDQVRALQEKPADKLMSGMLLRAMVAAVQAHPDRQSAAYKQAVGKGLDAELSKLPFATVRNEILAAKASAELMSEALMLGSIRDALQPVATKAGALSSDLAPALVGSRFGLEYVLPLKDVLMASYSRYVAANQTDKPDIWKDRDLALPAGRDLKPVHVVIWDSGVDPQLFGSQWIERNGKKAFIAFDHISNPSSRELMPIPAEWSQQVEQLNARTKGLSDLQSNIDSPEAREVRSYLSGLKPEQYKPAIEQLSLAGSYQHGTHVAGIAMAGNPYARLASARIEFGYKLLPDPCPSEEEFQRGLAAMKAYGGFIKDVEARVVNMSWGGSVRGYEVALEMCNIGKDKDERRSLARRYFQGSLEALTAVINSLPQVLFVAAAGNSADDPSFSETMPAGIVAPNLVVVGAVDKAGDEASFTSYGRTVALHANGHQVDSFIPGGKRVALSGTSMAAPQVTGLAAKILAVNPALKPTEVIEIMRRTAERSADGRRTLIHPQKAVAAAAAR